MILNYQGIWNVKNLTAEISPEGRMLQETKISTIGAVNSLISNPSEEAWRPGFKKCYEIISRLTLAAAQTQIDVSSHQRLRKLMCLGGVGGAGYYSIINRVQNASRLLATITLSPDPVDSWTDHLKLTLNFFDDKKRLAWLVFCIEPSNGQMTIKPWYRLTAQRPKGTSTGSTL